MMTQIQTETCYKKTGADPLMQRFGPSSEAEMTTALLGTASHQSRLYGNPAYLIQRFTSHKMFPPPNPHNS
jgi:hypothetical protein